MQVTTYPNKIAMSVPRLLLSKIQVGSAARAVKVSEEGISDTAGAR